MKALIRYTAVALVGTGVLAGGVAAQPPRPTMRSLGPARPALLPGTRESVFSMIQGNALSSTNGILANATVRLRDARIGQILETQLTDRAGLFTFRAIDPGTYVVELLGNDQSTVLAASQMLAVNAGQMVSAIVKLPFRIAPMAGVLGHTTASATTVSSAAAASGVLASRVTGIPTSPE